MRAARRVGIDNGNAEGVVDDGGLTGGIGIDPVVNEDLRILEGLVDIAENPDRDGGAVGDGCAASLIVALQAVEDLIAAGLHSHRGLGELVFRVVQAVIDIHARTRGDDGIDDQGLGLAGGVEFRNGEADIGGSHVDRRLQLTGPIENCIGGLVEERVIILILARIFPCGNL